MKYTLGLDLGIASIGWSVIHLDKNRIENLGVRIFTEAENPKTGESLAMPRRQARGARRRLHRKAVRMNQLRKLFVQEGLLTPQEKKTFALTHPNSLSPWQLRSEGLDRLLNPTEWARILFHIAKHRGFKSNRKNEQKKEEGALLSGITENSRLMEERGWRSTGEMFWCDEKFADKKRNHQGEYSHTVARKDLVEEVTTLFNCQKNWGNSHCSSSFQDSYLEIMQAQKSFSSGDDILKLVGKCALMPHHYRAPRACYSAERFVALQRINNLQILSDGEKISLTMNQKEILQQEVLLKKELKFYQIRKLLDLKEFERFNLCRYEASKKFTDSEKSIFIRLPRFHELRSCIEKHCGPQEWTAVIEDTTQITPPSQYAIYASSFSKIDALGWALSFFKTDEDIKEVLQNMRFKESVIEAIIDEGLSFDGVIDLSLEVLVQLNPHMQKGLAYHEAVTAIGLHHSRKEKNAFQGKIHYQKEDFEDIKNPVVLRGISQCRKLVNAIIREYGKPESIHVELARDIARPKAERNKIENRNKNRQIDREKIKQEFMEHYEFEPKSLDLLKFRLFKEQNSVCPYSGEILDPSRLLEAGYVDIDHIIPYSRSHDDSLANKVLVKAEENRRKRNLIPFEYLGSSATSDQWHLFSERCKNLFSLYPRKLHNLLRLSWNEEDAKEFISRNLNDTRYFSRFIAEYLHRKLDCEVIPINGQLTALLRARWGLIKVRDDSDLHHAMDATVVACASRSMVQRAALYSKRQELLYAKDIPSNLMESNGDMVDPQTGEIYTDKFPLPWQGFRHELLARLSETDEIVQTKLEALGHFDENFIKTCKAIFVSRMPHRKGTGAAHEATIRSSKFMEEQGISVTRESIHSIKLDNNNEFAMFDKTNNQKLYQAIKERLLLHGNDPKKAWATPLYKPTNDGSQGPEVKRVRMQKVQNTGVSIGNHGIADNDSMVRVDVFSKNHKYFLVPVYVADLVKKNLPNQAIAAHTPETQWPEMDNTYTYLFTLYPNDLVRVELKKKHYFGYYKGADRNTGTLTIEEPARRGTKDRPGVKQALIFEKYNVDYLGRVSRIRNGGQRPGVISPKKVSKVPN